MTQKQTDLFDDYTKRCCLLKDKAIKSEIIETHGAGFYWAMFFNCYGYLRGDYKDEWLLFREWAELQKKLQSKEYEVNKKTVEVELLKNKNKFLIKKNKDKTIDSFRQYDKLVRKLTELNDLTQLEHCDKRGFFNYHLDHIISVWNGWINKIPAEDIAHISNLQFIPYKENLLKGR